ncbi:MAG: MFS transporter [Bifidobacterium animalis]|nr:MFS transporter [Bifidobacterium animalis]MDY5039821.1 MFS transporter [Bifidobacterium animalis]
MYGEGGNVSNLWWGRAGLLLGGQAFSLVGSSIVQYAISWYLVMQTNSGIVVMLTMLMSCLPQAIVSLFAGAWSDRWNRKMLIILPDAVIAVITALLACAMGSGNASLALILCILAIRSAGAGVQTPAVQSFIPQITPEAKLLRVNSVNGGIQSVNMIASPAIAAVLVNMLPLWQILFVDVLTAIIGVCCVALIRFAHVRQQANTEHHTENVWRSLLSDTAEGFGYAWQRPRIRSVLLCYALVCFLNTAPMNLTLVLINRVFQGQSLDFGVLSLSSSSDKLAADQLAWSLGMVVGNVWLSSVGAKRITNTMKVIASAFMAMGVLTAMLGLAPTVLVYLIVDCAVGFATAMSAAPTFTMLQQEVPPDRQGRVFGLLTTFSSFGTPLGLLVFGPLSDIMNIRLVFILGGILTIPAGIWIEHVNRTHRVQQLCVEEPLAD